MKYLALLRGINVGGNNLISMAALRECFEGAGLKRVTTYIQSGNVLFESSSRDITKLNEKIERLLCDRFGYEARVVLLSKEQLESVLTQAPPDFGAEPESYRYDVAFLRTPLGGAELLPTIALRDGVDAAFCSDCVLYLRKLVSKATQSKFPKLVSHPEYKNMTIRNWNTTTKLHQLMA